jgi:Putative auto-transporter adhesin, head GIN domain
MLSGSGVAALGGLLAREARAVVQGSGRIDLTASRALDASIPGTGAIVYGGNPPHVTTSISGVGAVTPR